MIKSVVINGIGLMVAMICQGAAASMPLGPDEKAVKIQTIAAFLGVPDKNVNIECPQNTVQIEGKGQDRYLIICLRYQDHQKRCEVTITGFDPAPAEYGISLDIKETAHSPSDTWHTVMQMHSFPDQGEQWRCRPLSVEVVKKHLRAYSRWDQNPISITSGNHCTESGSSIQAREVSYGPEWKTNHPTPEAEAHFSEKASLCLDKKQDTRSWLKKIWHSITAKKWERVKADTRPFYFATDTAFGLKAAWDGTTGPYPSTVKLGYNRKELAYPPIYARPVEATPECSNPSASSNTPEHMGPWKVTVPSFVASLDNSSSINDGWEWATGKGETKDAERDKNGVTHIQFFATGKAASEFVKRREVNAAMNKAMYRHTE